MQAQQNASGENSAATKTPRAVFTVAQFADLHPAFSQSALRNLIFKAEDREGAAGIIPGNGLAKAGAIVRIGRKILIDEARFFEWVESQNARG